jgi:hypothetical protein
MKALVIGLILILSGICLMSSCNVAYTTTKQSSIAYTTSSWELTCNLTAGDTVIFRFYTHKMWVQEENETYSYYDYSDDEPPVAVLRVLISITDPYGNATLWDYDLAVYNASTSHGYIEPQLIGWAISKIKNGSIDTSPMLDSTGKLSDVGGIIPFTGTYKTQLSVYPPRPSNHPPSYLGFFHNVTVTDYPYTYLLPVGGATLVFGGTVSLLGARGIVTRHRKHIKSGESKLK